MADPAPRHGQAKVTMNQPRLGSTHGAGHFAANKAGMGAVSKEHVEQVVQEMSKGSKYFENAQNRDKQLEERLRGLKVQLAQTSKSQLQAYAEAMESAGARAEAAERQLSAIWVVVDMDAFYASVEIRDRPELASVPMAVGGMGMLTTANYMARKYGVRAAMPGFIAKKLCPQLVLVSPDFSKYTAAADEVRTVLRRYDPDFAAMSLDEAYLCLTPYLEQQGVLTSGRAEARLGTSQVGVDIKAEQKGEDHDGDEDSPADAETSHISKRRRTRSRSPDHPSAAHAPPTLAQVAAIADVVARIRAEVKAATRGLTCSAGIGPNPMLAKIASNDNKPDGQAIVPWDRDAILDYMSRLLVRSIPGVGKVTERILTEIGLRTCADILSHMGTLRAAFNERMSLWLMRCALGIASAERSSVVNASEGEDDVGRKSISMERTFRDCNDWDTLRAKAEELAAGVADDMAKEGIVGSTVTLKLKADTFEVLQRSASLTKPSADPQVLANAAVSLLRAAWPLRLRLMGFRMSGLRKLVMKPTILDAFLDKAGKSSGRGAGVSDAGVPSSYHHGGPMPPCAGMEDLRHVHSSHPVACDCESEIEVLDTQRSHEGAKNYEGAQARADFGSDGSYAASARHESAVVAPARHLAHNSHLDVRARQTGALDSYFFLQAKAAGYGTPRHPLHERDACEGDYQDEEEIETIDLLNDDEESVTAAEKVVQEALAPEATIHAPTGSSGHMGSGGPAGEGDVVDLTGSEGLTVLASQQMQACSSSFTGGRTSADFSASTGRSAGTNAGKRGALDAFITRAK